MPYLAGAYRPVALLEAPRVAYSEESVHSVRDMGFNWVYLMGFSGYPPETETLTPLRDAVHLYQKAGIQVCATLPVSSCAYAGSYRERSWWALDSSKHRIPAGEGRAFVCWNAPEWLAEVQDNIRQLIDCGVDGIFFREPWVGGIPYEMGNGLLGSAGCHDARCRSAYAEAMGGAEIPKWVHQHNARSRQYLAWRADLAVSRLKEWIAFGHALKPDLHVAIEGVDPLRYDAWVQFGIDLQQFGELADRVVIEGELARWDGTLNQNASALAASAIHTAVLMRYISPLADQTLAANLAEAQAEQGVAIPSDPNPVSEAAARLNRWIVSNEDWLGQGVPCAPVGIYVPPLQVDWARSAPYVWAACQSVIQNGLPFRLVFDDDWSTLNTLIVPPGEVAGLDDRLTAWDGQVIALHQKRPGRLIWTAYDPPRQSWLHWSALRWLTYPVGTAIRSRSARPGKQAPQWSPPHHELMEALGTEFTPRVETEGQGAVLFVMRRESNGEEQWHFVNYADEPQRVTVHASDFVSGWVHSPQEAWRTRIFGHSLIMTIADYKVVRLLKQRAGD